MRLSKRRHGFSLRSLSCRFDPEKRGKPQLGPSSESAPPRDLKLVSLHPLQGLAIDASPGPQCSASWFIEYLADIPCRLGDLNIWNAHNPRERFWASRTKQLHASHVTTHDRLWSCLPYMRPLVTIIADSLSWYGEDEHGGRVHDLLGTRCDPYINTVLSGQTYDFHCHSNLTRAVTPFGLNESDVHDVINLFQVTGLDEKGRYFMNPCPAEAGDYIEFLAEQDVLMALSKS